MLASKPTPVRDVLAVTSPRFALVDDEVFLVNHFSNVLAELICFRPDGATNPFALHLLPLARSSSLVLGAIETISAAHLHVLGSKSLSDARGMHSKVLRGLSTHIASDTLDVASGQLALASTLLLVYFEVSAGHNVLS